METTQAKITAVKINGVEDKDLTKAFQSTKKKIKWGLMIELEYPGESGNGDYVTFEGNEQLTIEPDGAWPAKLNRDPQTGSIVTIRNEGVPDNDKHKAFNFKILDSDGEEIDPVIIPR